MNNHSTMASQAKKLPGWLILFLRWILGGLIGVGLSSWFYFGITNHANTGSFFWFGELLSSVIAVPFAGHVYLFYLGTNPLQQIEEFFTTFPVLFWGLISALLASGRTKQIKAGVILLILYVVVGIYSFFRAVMMVPT